MYTNNFIYKPKWFICIITIFLFFICYTNATHFRYGTITWVASTTDPYQYQFSLKVAFRLGYFGSNLKVGDHISYGYVYIFDNLQSFKNSQYNYYASVYTDFIINNIDVATDWLTCEMLFSYTFSNSKPEAYITYYDGDRLSTLINNADGMWNVGTYINLAAKPDRSPKSGVLPVMNAYVGYLSNWQIPVIDLTPNSYFRYNLTDKKEMPGDQPAGMTCTADGVVSFTAPQIGYYSAQVKLMKYVNNVMVSTITVDFLVNARPKPDGPILPPMFISPTPEANSTVRIQTLVQSTINIVGKSPQTQSSVTIAIGNVPEGLTVTQQTNGPVNVGSLSLLWTPNTQQINVFVITLGLMDDQGLNLPYGVHTFFIEVVPPLCGGNGHMENDRCICNTGWAGINCTECAPLYYGPLCKKIPPCVHGKPNDGILGDGTCVCDQGWYGLACNFSMTQRCDLSTPNLLIEKSHSIGNLLMPSNVLLYLNPLMSTPVTVRSNIPPISATPIDLYFIYDTTLSKTGFLSSELSQYQKFIDNFKAVESACSSAFENVKFGLAYYSDNGANPLQVKTLLKSSIAADILDIKASWNSPLPNYNFQAMINATTQLQWSSSGSLRIMILITDNYLAPTNPTLLPLLKENLIKNNILLGVFDTAWFNKNPYVWMTPQIGVYYKSGFYSYWLDEFVPDIISPLATNPLTMVVGDPSFISSGPTNITSGTFETSFRFNSSYKEQSTKINVIGFGSQTVNILINHPPTTTNTIFSMNENTRSNFDIKASDVDNNILNIIFNTIPSIGKLYVNGTEVLAGVSYPFPKPQSNSFLYIPTPYKNGIDQANYTIDDGCASVSGSVLITINNINYIPTCSDLSFTVNQTTSQIFAIQSADPDGDEVTISFKNLNRVNAIGSIVIEGNGTPIAEGIQYPSSTNFIFTPIASASTNITIPVFVSDSESQSQCALRINIARYNTPPVISINTQLVMRPDSTLNIPFSIQDIDPKESIQISITAINPVNGKFFDTQKNQIVNIPYQLGGTINMLSTIYASNISYQAINANENGITFTIEVTDKGGLKDTKTVSISVDGDVSPYPPVATPVNTITTNQNTISAPFNLTGTHPLQPAYKGNFNIFINTPPQSGSLLQSDGTPLSSMLAPLSIAYKPNSEKFFGNDQFSFSVIDDKNLQSDPIIVQIIVEKVDYPPVIQLNPSSILTHLSCSETIKSIPISILVDNINVMNNLQVNIIKLPELGSITYDGQTIEQVPTLIDNTKGIQYSPILNAFKPYNATYQVEACDVKCSNITGTINYQFIPSEPTGEANTNIETNQNQLVEFKLTGNDCQYPSTIKFQFSSLPTSGILYDVSGTQVNNTNDLFSTNIFTYKPNKDVSDFNNGGLPLESFSYIVINEFSMNSLSYPIRISVHPIPTYTGERTLTTLENIELTIPIRASAPDGKQFTMNIKSFTGNGQLYYYDQTSTKVVIPSTGLSILQRSYTLYYMPPFDVYGSNIDSFTFTLNQTYSSELYSINIDVTRVFKPPLLVPLTYTNNGTEYPITKGNTIQLFENSSTIITLNVTSPDHPWESLNSTFGSGVTSAGIFCQYNETSSNEYKCGDKITLNSDINRSADGLWRVVFIPNKGRSGVRLVQFIVIGTDPLSMTNSQRLYISVLRINIPPVVNVQQFQYNTLPNIPVALNNVSVYDPDSTERNNITFTLTLSNVNDQSLNHSDGIISIPFANPYSCNITNTTVSCIDRNNILNRFLNTLSVNFPASGQYRLLVYVNDLGYNAMNPNEWKLSDNKTIDFIVGTASTSGGKKNNTVVLSAAIAAAAVAAAIIAVGVWRVMKARAPPTDAFFGDSPFSDGNVSSNPLYVENPNTSMNPLYVDPEN